MDADQNVVATSSEIQHSILTSSTSSASPPKNQTSQSMGSTMQQQYTQNRQTASHSAPSSRLQSIGLNIKSWDSRNLGTGLVKNETATSTGTAYYRPGWSSRKSNGFGGLTRQQYTPQKPHIARGMIPPQTNTTLSPGKIEYDVSCKGANEEFDEFGKDGNSNNTGNEVESGIVDLSYDKTEVAIVPLSSDAEGNDSTEFFMRCTKRLMIMAYCVFVFFVFRKRRKCSTRYCIE